MVCPKCRGAVNVIGSRTKAETSIKRRRRCDKCGYTFETKERVVVDNTSERVVDSTSERFDMLVKSLHYKLDSMQKALDKWGRVSRKLIKFAQEYEGGKDE